MSLSDWASGREGADIVGDGIVRVRTDLMLPDGHLIDVFVQPAQGGYRVCDQGQCAAYLSDTGHDPYSPTGAVRSRSEDICEAYGVEWDGGALTRRSDDIVGLSGAIVRVSSAQLALAWRCYHRHRPTPYTGECFLCGSVEAS